MSQDKILSDSISSKVVALGDAAWMLLEKHSIDQIDFDTVADMANVERELGAALGGSVQCLVLTKMNELHRQSLMETYDDIQDAGAISIREKIIESLLHLFETYAPYRSQIEHLNRSLRTHPELALRLLDGLQAVIRRILVMSGDQAHGLKGILRVKGVSGVFLATARVWIKDDSNDLAATMKMLDQRMSQAEEWGISLRVFNGGRSPAGVDDQRHDHVAPGCYGVDND